MAKKKKILLLTAPRPEPGYSPVHFGDNRPPQGLGYLAAYAKTRGHEADIVDLYAFGGKEAPSNEFVGQEEIGKQLDIDLFGRIKEFGPDFIGMYVHTMSLDTACELSADLKKTFPRISQVCGGPHPTIMPESMPQTFDYVAVGEGEHVLVDIMEGRTSKRIVRGACLKSRDLEKLPWPDFDFFWKKPYNWGLKLFNRDVSPVLTISTSRGCPFRCRFCGVKHIYPHYTAVSAHRVFDRMKEMHGRYGAKTFYFREDNFTAHLGRLERFCDLVISSGIDFSWICESRVRELSPHLIEKIARSGCLGLYIGCESGSPRVLENMLKDETRADFLEKFPILHEHGISTYTTWVYGTPGEAPKDRRMTDELINTLNPTAADRFIYIGIPRSDYYDDILAGGSYEFIDKCGFLYPNGYLSLATSLYGYDDPRVKYVRRIYTENKVVAVDIPW